MLHKFGGATYGQLALVFALICLANLYVFIDIGQPRNFSKFKEHDGALGSWDAELDPVLEADVSFHDHGLLARHVARLARLADGYDTASRPDLDRLELAIGKLFPWWRPQAQRYVPWRHEKPDRPRFHFRGEDHGRSQTGIVICVGNRGVALAAQLIVTLRKVLGSELPIEFAFAGDKDLSPRWRYFLHAQADFRDIHPLDLTEVFDNDLVDFQTWDTKPFALLAARHPQTILMDADALFFTAPDDIFDTHPQLRESGNLFFHDRAKYWTDATERRVWLAEHIAAAGRQPSEYLNTTSMLWAGDFITENQDSAVVMIDKSRPRQYLALLFAAWMNGRGPREVTYQYLYGDKETYWLACELTGTPYSFEPWSAARFGENTAALENTGRQGEQLSSCTEHMVHPTSDGSAPLFANGGIWRDKTWHADGFANWTHWYLGKPLKSTFADAKASLNLSDSVNYATELAPDIKEQYEETVLRTQPSWALDGCEQPQPERWTPLSKEFRDRMQEMVRVAGEVQEAYEREKEKEHEHDVEHEHEAR